MAVSRSPSQLDSLPSRRFSQQIRLVLGKPDGLAEARSLCAAQMDEAHALLADDAAFRAEYMRLWEGQRKNPISPFSVRLACCFKIRVWQLFLLYFSLKAESCVCAGQTVCPSKAMPY